VIRKVLDGAPTTKSSLEFHIRETTRWRETHGSIMGDEAESTNHVYMYGYGALHGVLAKMEGCCWAILC